MRGEVSSVQASGALEEPEPVSLVGKNKHEILEEMLKVAKKAEEELGGRLKEWPSNEKEELKKEVSRRSIEMTKVRQYLELMVREERPLSQESRALVLDKLSQKLTSLADFEDPMLVKLREKEGYTADRAVNMRAWAELKDMRGWLLFAPDKQPGPPPKPIPSAIPQQLDPGRKKLLERHKQIEEHIGTLNLRISDLSNELEKLREHVQSLNAELRDVEIQLEPQIPTQPSSIRGKSLPEDLMKYIALKKRREELRKIMEKSTEPAYARDLAYVERQINDINDQRLLTARGGPFQQEWDEAMK